MRPSVTPADFLSLFLAYYICYIVRKEISKSNILFSTFYEKYTWEEMYMFVFTTFFIAENDIILNISDSFIKWCIFIHSSYSSRTLMTRFSGISSGVNSRKSCLLYKNNPSSFHYFCHSQTLHSSEFSSITRFSNYEHWMLSNICSNKTVYLV
jgi:hypothetical protein